MKNSLVSILIVGIGFAWASGASADKETNHLATEPAESTNSKAVHMEKPIKVAVSYKTANNSGQTVLVFYDIDETIKVGEVTGPKSFKITLTLERFKDNQLAFRSDIWDASSPSLIPWRAHLITKPDMDAEIRESEKSGKVKFDIKIRATVATVVDESK